MKRNLSKAVLIVEIISIALLHAAKIKSHQDVSITRISPAKTIVSSKAPYLLLKIK